MSFCLLHKHFSTKMNLVIILRLSGIPSCFTAASRQVQVFNRLLVAAPHPVVVDLLEGLVADGALEDDALEGVALVTRHQLHADHLPLAHRHVTEDLRTHAGREGL